MENDNKIVPYDGVGDWNLDSLGKLIPTEMKPGQLAFEQRVAQATQIGLPTPQELMVYETWAKNAADSQMYRTVGKESAIMMIMLAAREYGIGPAQALNGGLHIIEGKVELSARMMSALIRRSKHKLHIVESTDEKCTIRGVRADTGEVHVVTYTIEMAQKAGLIKEKGGWKRTPEDMLFARTLSRLARQLFSDVIGIGYIEGEISSPQASNEEIEPSKEWTMKDLMDITTESPAITTEYLNLLGATYQWDQKTALTNLMAKPKEQIISNIENYARMKREKSI